MLREWLEDSVGLETARAQFVASQLAAAGCSSIEHLSGGHALLQSLNLELEEWEAVALTSAIADIVTDDELFCHDPAFKQVVLLLA